MPFFLFYWNKPYTINFEPITCKMLDYILILAGIVMLFVTILPPTWHIDLGTLILGALLLYQGMKELSKRDEMQDST